ncbi:MAG TPA: DNA repair protein RecN [Candidatus Binatia bacterium]|nr:DNA repair protein RecN [Candidatus Binatia bacterium]
MLRELRIKNFTVIDEVALELGAGLNVLTGETGAGKSIVLNALGLVSGNRVSADIIRHNEDEASVEALFEDPPAHVSRKLADSGFDAAGELVIKRIVSRSGKNRVYLGGSLCPLGLLSEIGDSIIHIYGQHEHHTLLNPQSHIGLLDAFGGLPERAAKMGERFRALASAWQTLRQARELLEKRKKEKGLLEAQVEEIAKAHLRPDDEDELQAQKNILAHAEKLHQGCLEGEELLYEGDNALIGRLGRYGGKLRELANIDAALQPAVELIDAASAHLEEANAALRRYGERVHFEPGALEQLEDRLAALHRLKRKYGGSIEEILKMQVEMEAALRALERGEEEIPALERAFETARREAWETAGALSLERQRIAKRFKREMEEEAKGLGMPETIFEVHFQEATETEDDPPFHLGARTLTESGMDQIEFYFSPNPGEPPKPLAKIASGGELSRLMLAIKSLVLTPGDIPTLLFDEVDAGIGGGVAEIVGKKLKQVASAHQVICVTHLPQIAALADSHHVVRKEVSKGRTVTTVEKLKEPERVDEVARMLGGLKITDKTRRHAEEMVRGK